MWGEAPACGGSVCGRRGGMPEGFTMLALCRPICVERMTGGGTTGPVALVAGGPPGISGLDIIEKKHTHTHTHK
jgi:hypothetical protein